MCAIKAPLFAATGLGVALVGFLLLSSSTGEASAPLASREWAVVVPPKKIVSGVIGAGCVALKPADACATAASIFPNAPRNIDESKMGVQGGTLENPYCAGGIEGPSPAPGYLCIYPNTAESVNVALTSDGLIDVEPHPIYNGRRGFKITWSAKAAGSTQLYAVWAYRAP